MKKNIINIINEEISNFDFLGNEKYLKEEEINSLLQNEDFQKQFICDSLLNKNNLKTKIAEAQISGDWEEGNEASNLNIKYQLDFEYVFDLNKEPIKFIVDFNGNNVGINITEKNYSGDYNNEPQTESYYDYINWSDIDVTLLSNDGDEIDFIAFKKAPIKIKELFIRNYTESFISNKTTSTDKLKRDNIKNIPYC